MFTAVFLDLSFLDLVLRQLNDVSLNNREKLIADLGKLLDLPAATYKQSKQVSKCL